MKVNYLISQAKIRFASICMCLILIATGCNTPNVTEVSSHPGVPGFDWGNDPLEVTINEEQLVSGIERDTLDLIAKDMHTYFTR